MSVSSPMVLLNLFLRSMRRVDKECFSLLSRTAYARVDDPLDRSKG